jgi:hypothetical protein
MSRPPLAWLPICVALGVLAAAVIARACFGIPWLHVMGDPAGVTGWPFYLGFVSNAGAVLWTAGASIFFFSYCVHRANGGDPQWGRFLLCSGLFVALLGVDDLFMLHDQAIPNYTGVSQTLVVASYAGVAALYVVRFAPLIAQTAYPVFVAAIALLGFSAGLDQIQDRFAFDFAGKGFWEDAAKLLGIGTWLSYAVHTAAALLSRRSTAAAQTAAATLPELRLKPGSV